MLDSDGRGGKERPDNAVLCLVWREFSGLGRSLLERIEVSKLG
ncbi:MAG: hypothetical protein AB1589_14130 [Cyanobacteriota bacterium]